MSVTPNSECSMPRTDTISVNGSNVDNRRNIERRVKKQNVEGRALASKRALFKSHGRDLYMRLAFGKV
jgi:hypothetical protein